MAEDRQVDIAIVGAGMVGASLACALADSGLSIALLDTQAPLLEWPQAGFDLRVSAITRASERLFTDIGAWPTMQAQRVSPFREMHVWDAAGEGTVHFDSADVGETHLGHIIENRVIVAALHTRLATRDNVAFLCPHRLVQVRRDGRTTVLYGEDGSQLRCALVVGADGGRSWIRRQAAIPVHGWDYDHHALVTYVRTQRHHAETAWQRFLPTGPLAFLPLSDGWSSIVWSTSPQQADALCAMPDAQFACELEAAFEYTLGTVEETGPRATYPLRFFDARRYIAPGLALVGDAAHTMHPLAGQGVNLGLADVASLVAVLHDALAKGRAIGSEAVLRRYERWRKADNLTMLATVDSFKRVFGSDMQTVKTLRNLGLGLANRIGPLRNTLMRVAMGMEQ
ncbi:MAG TPA: 2-octaprenyl-3-methyl-6-methoxy-1,4-benzoquinol hydroxylase [Gammaproteobacteria bacterium]|nr:2-octaprenyl-3-methyl-6-methoxy-1,4-benzoquinol hydroxylase [Gammaproteobacteria bacterium]